jgi:hypothetical protein
MFIVLSNFVSFVVEMLLRWLVKQATIFEWAKKQYGTFTASKLMRESTATVAALLSA